jgi:hypothetical protein
VLCVSFNSCSKLYIFILGILRKKAVASKVLVTNKVRMIVTVIE